MSDQPPGRFALPDQTKDLSGGEGLSQAGHVQCVAGTALLLVSDAPQSASAACATLSCRRERALWEAAPGGRMTLVGQLVRLGVPRSRLGAPLAPASMVLRR